MSLAVRKMSEIYSSTLSPEAGSRSLMDRRVDSQSIRFLTAVVRASLGSHMGKPSSAYGWSGGFPRVLRFSPTFDERSARYK